MKIRIAVVMNDKGHWNAFGFYKWNDDQNAACAMEGLDEVAKTEATYFVEADVPVPAVQIIAASKIETES